MCLNLHLSNSMLLAPSNDVLDAAVGGEISPEPNGGLTSVIFLHSFYYSQGWLGCCDSEPQTFCFSLLFPPKSTSCAKV